MQHIVIQLNAIQILLISHPIFLILSLLSRPLSSRRAGVVKKLWAGYQETQTPSWSLPLSEDLKGIWLMWLGPSLFIFQIKEKINFNFQIKILILSQSAIFKYFPAIEPFKPSKPDRHRLWYFGMGVCVCIGGEAQKR